MPPADPDFSSAHLPPAVAEALARGAVVLTPDQGSARGLRAAFDQDRREHGQKRWKAPPILARVAWLNGLWSALLLSGAEQRLLLNRSQEHTLWRSILAADEEVSGLHSLDALAALAAEAWHRLRLHGGEGRALQTAASTPDTLAFARWAAEFERTCRRRRYASPAELPLILVNALSAGTLDVPASGIALVDQGKLPPAHAELFDGLRRAGYDVADLKLSSPETAVQLHAGSDDAAELRAAAHWLFEQHSANPHARLALVVPDLVGRGLEVHCALTEAFSRDASVSRTDRVHDSAPSSFELLFARPLSDTAVGNCAILLLRWTLGPLPVAAISHLLLSPFFAATSPELAAAAAEFDASDLRRTHLLRPELTMVQCGHRIRHSRCEEPLQPLLQRLNSASRLTPEPGELRSHGGWADRFRSVLVALGWAAATERDNIAFETARCWEGALDELTTLDFEGGPVTAATALDSLARIAHETGFAPTPKDAPVEVLDPLAMSGRTFDALWFLGVDDAAWPPAATPHPLLPWPLQHALRMPGTDSDRDLAEAERLTSSIVQSTARVVFSYAAEGAEERRRVSPLLKTFNAKPYVDPSPSLETALALEVICDDEPLPSLPDEVVHGGASLLKLQAACSFRAFAELRLGANEPERVEQGFSPRESGTVIHEVMHRFWGDVQSQDRLRSMDSGTRRDVLWRAIDLALADKLKHAHGAWDHAYLAVQRQRLMLLLEPWLETELARPPFTVLLREQAFEDLSIGPLRLRLRVDRVDETPGGRLILDYKSGAASAKAWQGERPEEPQLPLYAVLTEGEDLGGIAFAMLRAGKGMGLEGVSRPGILPKTGLKEGQTMELQVAEWRRVLETLAYDFASGTVHVRPKDFPKTCERCGQRLICRLDSSTLQVDDPPENASAGYSDESIDG